jgi:hypothetical protein
MEPVGGLHQPTEPQEQGPGETAKKNDLRASRAVPDRLYFLDELILLMVYFCPCWCLLYFAPMLVFMLAHVAASTVRSLVAIPLAVRHSAPLGAVGHTATPSHELWAARQARSQCEGAATLGRRICDSAVAYLREALDSAPSQPHDPPIAARGAQSLVLLLKAEPYLLDSKTPWSALSPSRFHLRAASTFSRPVVPSLFVNFLDDFVRHGIQPAVPPSASPFTD